MLDRCDLATHRECSYEPSGVPCRTQPGVKEIIRDANTKAATQGPALIVGIIVFFAIGFYAATKFGTTGI